MIRRLAILIIVLSASAFGASYAITAVQVDGTTTAAVSGTGAASSGVITAATGAFTPCGVNEGIIYNGAIYAITACTSSSSVTVTPTVTNATTTTPWSMISSACVMTSACNGWVVELTMSNSVATGGTYSLGLSKAANFTPSTANVTLTCTSSGFTNSGGTTTYTRTIYGTRQLRQPDPNYQTNDETNNGSSTMIIRLALSDFVYSGDTCTIQVAAGIYTDGSGNTNSALTAGSSVTNNSTLAYSTARVIANWSRPGWQRINGSTMTLAAVAFDRHPLFNLPVACIVFTVTDQHSHSVSQTVTVPTIDTTQGDGPTYNVAGSYTSGTFQASEQVKQTGTGALAWMVNVPVSGTTNLQITSIITGTPNSSGTWVGVTSSAVFTPSGAPVLGPPNTKIVEYIATISTATFTQGDQLTANFKAYPWIGNSGSTMDTSDGTYSQPTPLYAPQYYLFDTSNVYSAAGYVDASSNIALSSGGASCVNNELMTQATTSAKAYLISSSATNLHIGQIISGTANGTNNWTGGTSGCTGVTTGSPIAVGADTNSCAAAESAGQPASPCATINGALIKMAAFNNASSTPTHNDACGTLFMAAGYYNWMGSNAADSNTTGKCWANLTTASGVSSYQVVIDTQNGSDNQGFGTRCTSGSTNCGTPLHLKGITVNTNVGFTSLFSSITYLWLDHTVMSCTGGPTACFYQVTVAYLTQGAVPAIATGVVPFGSVGPAFALLRGVDTTGTTGNFFDFTVLGNTNYSTTAQQYYVNEFSGYTAFLSTQTIFAYNLMYREQQSAGQAIVGFNNALGSIIGGAIVQNVFENNYTNETQAIFTVAADNSTSTPVNNYIVANNVVVGGRINRCYNEVATQTQPLFRNTWFESGNLFDLDAIKTDTFGTQAYGSRIGNWACLYGTGRKSSSTAELTGGSTGFTGNADFRLEFPGLQVYEVAWSGTNTNGTSTTNPIQSGSANGNPVTITGASMSGATATFVAGSAFPAAFALGNTFTIYGCTGVTGYNTTWLMTGGAGTTSITATAAGVSGLGSGTACTAAAVNYFTYNNRNAFDGSYANTGVGDYRVRTNSNANNFFTQLSGCNMLPYDEAGIVRDNRGYGAAGAYEQTALPQVFLTF